MESTQKDTSEDVTSIVKKAQQDENIGKYDNPIGSDSTKEDIDAAMEKVHALLYDGEHTDKLPDHVKTIMDHEKETQERTAKELAKKKQTPLWFILLFVTLIALGALFVIVYNISGTYPIPGIGKGNVFIGAGIGAAGLMMMTRWV
jgi:cobalamin biosynthesis Mg chelatase CobN